MPNNPAALCDESLIADVLSDELAQVVDAVLADDILLADVAVPLSECALDDAAQSDERALILPVHGTTVTAEDLRVRMVLASDFDQAMEIDASQVESVGQAVLQLLVAAKIEADAQGQPFILHNPSQAFVDRVTACGLAAAVGLPVEEEIQP